MQVIGNCNAILITGAFFAKCVHSVLQAGVSENGKMKAGCSYYDIIFHIKESVQKGDAFL